MTTQQTHLRTPEVNGVQVSVQVRLTPYYLGYDVVSNWNADDQAMLLIGLLRSLNSVHDHGTALGAALAGATTHTRADAQQRETLAHWLRTITAAVEAP